MRSLNAFIALLVLAAGLANPAAAKRVALVIGNSAYKHTAPLENPKHDAADMASALRGLGFEVISRIDLDKGALERTIREFAAALSGAEAGVFFYAGHGLQVAGLNYLVPIDAELSSAAALDFEMVRLDLVHRTMERETPTNILFLDACRNNPLARNLARAMGTRSSEIGRGLASVEAGAGTLISFSTQPGNVALDGTGRNSPFAAALLEQLLTSGQDIANTLINVRREVMKATGNRQVPWEHSSLTSAFNFGPSPTALSPQPTMTSDHQVEIAYWTSVKDSRQVARIRSYLEAYPNGAFVPLAKAMLSELESAAVPGRAHERTEAFNGRWEIALAGNQHCPLREIKFFVQVDKGIMTGGPLRQPGQVEVNGAFSFQSRPPWDPTAVIDHVGRLSGETGHGSYQRQSSSCAGAIALKRIGAQPAPQTVAGAPIPERGKSSNTLDGKWLLTRVGSGCRGDLQPMRFVIENGAIVGGRGTISESGGFRYEIVSTATGKAMQYTGSISKDGGKGRFLSIRGSCAGTFELVRQ